MHTISKYLLATVLVLGLIGVANTQTTTQAQRTEVSTSGEAFADVKVVQNEDFIVVTVTRIGSEPPEGPVIVPDPDAGDNGTIITPGANDTDVVVIPPNGTVVEVPGNITVVDNDTVIVAPDNETVTTTPGNATVIDPPAPEPCACPPIEEPSQNETGGIEPVVVQPAPGQEVITENGTELVANDSQEEPEPVTNDTGGGTTPAEPFPEPATNETGGNGGGNETGGNETTVDNETALAPAAFSQIFPWTRST